MAYNKEYQTKWRKEHPDYMRNYMREYNKENKEYYKVYRQTHKKPLTEEQKNKLRIWKKERRAYKREKLYEFTTFVSSFNETFCNSKIKELSSWLDKAKDLLKRFPN